MTKHAFATKIEPAWPLPELEVRLDPTDRSRAAKDRRPLVEDIARLHGKSERWITLLPWLDRCVFCQDFIGRRENQIQ
jgi:hypothetical protein